MCVCLKPLGLKNLLKHHVHCLAGILQCRISAHLAQPEKGLCLAVQDVHSQQLMKVPRFYNSSSDLLLRCNKPQSLALWRGGQICWVHKLMLAVNIPPVLCCCHDHTVLSELCLKSTVGAFAPPQALK